MRKHKRSLLLALLLCCISAITMVGIYRRETKGQKDELNDLVELSEADEDQVPSDEEVSALVQSAMDTEGVQKAPQESETPVPSGEPVPVIAQDEQKAEKTGEDSGEEDQSMEAVAEVAPEEPVLHFGEDSVLTWPVQGDVLAQFSMDRTIYFPTLEQYKYNPGMLIQSEEGNIVYAGADARVVQISQSDELGCTVTMDLGDSYMVKYGQLKALNVKEGDRVACGSAIGLVAAPTKYYVVEGDHVYLELHHEGVPVDPLDYLD